LHLFFFFYACALEIWCTGGLEYSIHTSFYFSLFDYSKTSTLSSNPDILSPILSPSPGEAFHWVFICLIELFIIRVLILLFFRIYVSWVPLLNPLLFLLFHSAVYLYPVWIHLVFICVFFNLIDNYYNHSFEFFDWAFFLWLILVFVTVGLWIFRGVTLPQFCIFLAHIMLSCWLEVLITCSLAIEMFSVFRQDCIVGGLQYNFIYWTGG
jgi:hypothetical protein